MMWLLMLIYPRHHDMLTADFELQHSVNRLMY